MKNLIVLLFVMLTGCSDSENNMTSRPPKSVKFTNPWDNTELSGEITYPNTRGEFKTIILISGHSGGEPPAKRDNEIEGHKYFLVLSRLLAAKGYAVLRYDNRGVGKSTGDWTLATDEHYASDAAAALKWVRGNANLKTTEVGFLGHSQGGFKAPMAALLEKPDFIVTLGSGVEMLADGIIRQNTEINHANGVDSTITKKQIETLKDLFEIIENAPTYEKSRQQIKEYLLKDKPDLSKKDLNLVLSIGIGSAWWYNAVKTDIKPIISTFDNPILELFGEKDLLVSAVVNAPLTAALLSHPKSAVHTFEGLNHLFQYTKKGEGPDEYRKIKTTIEAYVIDFIDEWIKGL